MSERASLIRMQNIHKVYGEGNTRVHALQGIDVEVGQGEFVAVMGPSGSGKSTCMNIVGCLDVPSVGSYQFCGVDIGDLSHEELAMLRRHYLGFVFQSFNLIARTDAMRNVELPLIYKGLGRKERRRRSLETLRDVGLLERADHTPAQLSGGQQQRVAIARALVSSPRLLLADEPTGNLDTTTSGEILALMRRLNEERDLTIMMVTHEPETASHADRVLIFVDGQLVQDGPPSDVLAIEGGGYR